MCTVANLAVTIFYGEIQLKYLVLPGVGKGFP
jgi:hypothetical protein